MKELSFQDFDDYRSSVPSRPIELSLQRFNDDDGDVVMRRRGSVYQSSREVRSNIRKKLIKHERKEGDLTSSLLASSSSQTQSNADFLSFEIVDRSLSLCCHHNKTSRPSPSSDQSKMIPNSDIPDLSFRIPAEGKCVSGCSSSQNNGDGDGFRKTLKSRYGGLHSKRMQEVPKLQSKYQRNLSASVLHKPPLDDSLLTENGSNGDCALTSLSPIHLSGVLKSERRINSGAMSFQFFLNNSEDVLSAKVWKTKSAFNWVYTFHKNNRKISTDRSVQLLKNKCRQNLQIIGQMQVSCYLCSEINKRSVDTSMIMEFVLHDIARARRNSGTREHLAEMKCCNDDDLESPDDSKPWLSMELLPHLEIAAVSLQVPPVKENENSRMNSNFLSPQNMKVIIPSGSHGLPFDDESCPSTLLDRWRSDGVCDCGGWDMGCPIDVFDNNMMKMQHHRQHQSLNLFNQVY